MLPLLLCGSIRASVAPSLCLRAWVQRLACGVWGIWRHGMPTFTVVRVRARRISRTLRTKANQLCRSSKFLLIVTLRICSSKSIITKKKKDYASGVTLHLPATLAKTWKHFELKQTHALTVWSRIVMMLVLRVCLSRWPTALLSWTPLVWIGASRRVSTVERV